MVSQRRGPVPCQFPGSREPDCKNAVTVAICRETRVAGSRVPQGFGNAQTSASKGFKDCFPCSHTPLSPLIHSTQKRFL